MTRVIIIFSAFMVISMAVFSVFKNHTISVQHGYRGTGAVELYATNSIDKSIELNSIPEADPIDDPDPSLPPVGKMYKNVQVLNDLSVLELSRLMGALAVWVAPKEGCDYCHNPANLASDEKYTKRVARKMLLMTRRINTEWKSHVAGVGVTCWTCHRGQAVPTGDWYKTSNSDVMPTGLGNKDNQNTPGIANVGNTALPFDPLTKYLIDDTDIRVQGTVPLAGSNPYPLNGVKKAEMTYAMMIYISKSLGVNCTYCHSTRAFGNWAVSTPQRSTAWYGVRMVRDLNKSFLLPIESMLPNYRLGELGDGPKVGCATCHKGTYKPLFGKSMKEDFPELWRAGGPQIDTGFVSPPPVAVVNPVVSPQELVNGKY
jgi:photosynthetic reaction center cytochrome c subunit